MVYGRELVSQENCTNGTTTIVAIVEMVLRMERKIVVKTLISKISKNSLTNSSGNDDGDARNDTGDGDEDDKEDGWLSRKLR